MLSIKDRGDFDGDQVTDKILWLQESNKELEDLMNQKQYFINTGGSLIRKVEIEVIQTFFNMTKNTTTNFRTISAGEKAELLGLAPEDLTFDVLVQFFGIMTDPITKKDRCRFHPEDKMTLATGEWYGKNKAPIDTTVGRYLFNKILLGRPGFQDAIPYVNDEVTEGYFFKKVEGAIANALLHDKIKVDQMYEYVDTRDWLGMQLHALITPSFTPETFKINPEVQKLKDELFEKHKDAIESGDTLIVSDIEKQLIAKTKEVLKGDPGMDLYDSGARGSIANNYKNMFIMRGSVYNRAKKKYEIVKNSLADTLAIKDIPVSSNTILEGAYPKACGTQDSGYMAKKLMSFCQSEILGEPGSDCGTKRGIMTEITDKNAKDYLYRYIGVGKDVKLMDENNINDYIGKTVELRSPMSCIRTSDGCICNKCGGEFYYMIGNRSIGLSASKIGNALTRLNMKKFHDNVVKLSRINVNDMFF